MQGEGDSLTGSTLVCSLIIIIKPTSAYNNVSDALFLHWRDCSAHFCHLNHFCHSSRLLSIQINHFCQPHHFCQLWSIQSSPVLSQISTTYVATDEVTTFVNRSAHFCRPQICPRMVFSHTLKNLCLFVQ